MTAIDGVIRFCARCGLAITIPPWTVFANGDRFCTTCMPVEPVAAEDAIGFEEQRQELDRQRDDAILAAVLRRLLAECGYISDRDGRLYIGNISDYGADVSDTEADVIRRVLEQ